MEHIVKVSEGNVLFTTKQMKQVANWGISKINAPAAWKITKGRGVKVAVFDTGIDVTHPDLKRNLVGGVNFTTPNRHDYIDRQGHGTHCAGIIGAVDNSVGVIGVAPMVELYAVKVLGDDGMGGLQAIMQGIDWAIENNIDVISMSLGIEVEPPKIFHEYFKKAYNHGIAVVVASGNENHYVGWPAAYPEVIAVGAVDINDQRANFSNFGQELDVIAPGVNIYSTYPVHQYAMLSGTSMATPMVAGAVALYIANRKEGNVPYTVTDIHHAISDSAKDLGMEGYDPYTGHGIVDLPQLLGIK